MKNSLKILGGSVLITFFAWGVTFAQNYAPYHVIEKGDKLTFDQLEKKHLGLACSVYCKPGKPECEVGTGGPDPEGMVTHRGEVKIVTGELNMIGRDYIGIFGFYTQEMEKGGIRSHHIQNDDIDYIVFKKGEDSGVREKSLPTKTVKLFSAISQDYAPYHVIETGEKLTFDQIDKKHLGLTCSVYSKPNKPQGVDLVGVPLGMVTQKNVVVWIVTGEIDAIGKNQMILDGFFTKKRDRFNGGCACPIQAEDIAYILFEKGKGTGTIQELEKQNRRNRSPLDFRKQGFPIIFEAAVGFHALADEPDSATHRSNGAHTEFSGSPPHDHPIPLMPSNAKVGHFTSRQFFRQMAASFPFSAPRPRNVRWPGAGVPGWCEGTEA